MLRSIKSLDLKARRYTILDSVSICFRCDPVAAFFYAFFDLASGFIIPLQALVVGRFIDSAIAAVRGGPIDEVMRFLFAVVAITGFLWLKRAVHNFADLALVLSIRRTYRAALTMKRARLAYRHIESEATWDLIQRVAANPEGGQLKLAYAHLVIMISFVIRVGGLLAILTSIVWWGGAAVVLVSALTLITGVRGGKKHYDAERDATRSERRHAYLTSLLVGREAAAERELFGYTDEVNRMRQSAFAQSFAIRMKARIRWFLSAYTGNIISLSSWVFVMIILLEPVASGAIGIGLFIALTQAFTNLDIVWGFMDTVHGLASDSEFFKDLTVFLGLEETSGAMEIDGAARPAGSTTIDLPVFSSLELRDVWFRYPGTEPWVLEGVSFFFSPGTHYAFVGENGAGKTTLMRLLTGLYKPERGEVILNGRNLAEYRIDELGAYFSIVYQDFARYQLSLRDNISVGRATREVDRIVDEVGLGDLIGRLPNGLDTHIGRLAERGVDISGGEWQRVAMARALAVPAPVRIFDEPTASLDPVAESRLFERFENLTADETTFLITHRLGATRNADSILVLADGRIAESGNHERLMQIDGLYRRMFESQRSWYE